ncbi:hypothetical protein BST61_g3572 [Cercospora zeina]
MTTFDTILGASLRELSGYALALAALSLLLVVLYRLFLSPLAHIPGPRLAAATGLIETYYDLVKGGQFIFKIAEWHRRYGECICSACAPHSRGGLTFPGPIIRVTPGEVHILDPEFFDEMYSVKSKTNKMAHLKYRLGITLATSEQIEHAEHHRRRAAIAPLFTTARVREFSGHLQSSMDKLCLRLQQEYAGTGNVLRLDDVFAAWTTDAVTWYAMAMSYGCAEHTDFKSDFLNASEGLIKGIHALTHMAFYAIRLIMDGENKGHETVAHRTVFFMRFCPPTSFGLMRKLLRFCQTRPRKPEVKERLQKELEAAIPDPSNVLSLSAIQNLPYLSVVVQEATRLMGGVSQRLFRTNPHTPLQYGAYNLPADQRPRRPKSHAIVRGERVSLAEGELKKLVHTKVKIGYKQSLLCPTSSRA